MNFWVKAPPDNEHEKKKKIQNINGGPWVSVIFLPSVILTTTLLLIGKWYYKNMVRYSTASMIPPHVFQKQYVLSGVVTSVGDADNFRFYHTPGGIWAGWHWLRRVPSGRKELKDQTIHVRLAGIDAPELSHFGKEGQPYGKEAMEWLTRYIHGKRINVRVFSRDRYERVVGEVRVRRWPFFWNKKNVALEMVKRGLAEVYKSQGAEYGGKLQEMKFKREEQRAKRKRVGMWKQNPKKYQSPREYKRRMHTGAPMGKLKK